MDITTNRVDAMNHYGVAREAAAIYNVALKTIQRRLRWNPGPIRTRGTRSCGAAEGFPVRIEAKDLCGGLRRG